MAAAEAPSFGGALPRCAVSTHRRRYRPSGHSLTNAFRYLQSYFPRDLLTALPWGVLTDAIEKATDYTAVSRLVRSIKLVRRHHSIEYREYPESVPCREYPANPAHRRDGCAALDPAEPSRAGGRLWIDQHRPTLSTWSTRRCPCHCAYSQAAP